MSSLLIPSYKNGFASCAAESENPGLWDGLVGLWAPHLGPTGLTLFDQSGRKHHGTLTNMDPATDWVPSPYGWALDFDGTEWIDVDDCFDVVGDFTFFTLFRTSNDITTRQHIYGTYLDYNNGGYGLRIENSSIVTLTWSGGIQYYRNHGAISANTWYLAAWVRLGVQSRLFVNGVEKGTPGAEGGRDLTTGLAHNIGARGPAGANPFIGKILFHAAYFRSFIPSEIQHLYRDPRALTRLRQSIYPAAAAPASGAISGSSSIDFLTGGSLAGGGRLTGTIAVAFTQAGTLGGRGALAGSSSAAFDAAATAWAIGELKAAAAFAFGADGTLRSPGSLMGTASVTFDATATARAIGELRAAAAAAFWASGTLVGKGELVGETGLAFSAALATTRVGAVTGIAGVEVTYGSDGAATEGTWKCQQVTI